MVSVFSLKSERILTTNMCLRHEETRSIVIHFEPAVYQELYQTLEIISSNPRENLKIMQLYSQFTGGKQVKKAMCPGVHSQQWEEPGFRAGLSDCRGRALYCRGAQQFAILEVQPCAASDKVLGGGHGGWGVRGGWGGIPVSHQSEHQRKCLRFEELCNWGESEM